MNPFFLFFTGLLCILFSVSSTAAEMTVRLARVVDGDTITVIENSNIAFESTIRLADIDCPEISQTHGKKARQAVLDMIPLNSIIAIETFHLGRYGRNIGYVKSNEQYLHRFLVEKGHCWVNDSYARDETLKELETQARENKAGIWSLPDKQRQAPWIWRAARKRNKN